MTGVSMTVPSTANLCPHDDSDPFFLRDHFLRIGTTSQTSLRVVILTIVMLSRLKRRRKVVRICKEPPHDLNRVCNVLFPPLAVCGERKGFLR